ncbi:helix-turn-helix transcriptional regulator [uncultured Victivallis sp.]|uniref:helix-turn-helix domain-containing protein n=1 Tax=uncultured Victivallis sp. TaxID=354118 RepID=UPI0025920F02|nr:helix-turn-helix transcriptional regulator [uncultured Victivallis sp.]
MSAEPFEIGQILPAVMGEDLIQLSIALQKAVDDVGSIAALSRKTNVSVSTISNLIHNKNKRRPKKETLKRLIKVTNRYLPVGTMILCKDRGYYRIISTTRMRLCAPPKKL